MGDGTILTLILGGLGVLIAMMTFMLMSINKRFDGMNDRFLAVNDRLDAVNDRLDAVNDRLDAVNDRLDTQEKQLEWFSQRLTAVEEGQVSLEAQMKSIQVSLEAQMKSNQASTDKQFRKVWKELAKVRKEMHKIHISVQKQILGVTNDIASVASDVQLVKGYHMGVDALRESEMSKDAKKSAGSQRQSTDDTQVASREEHEPSDTTNNREVEEPQLDVPPPVSVREPTLKPKEVAA